MAVALVVFLLAAWTLMGPLGNHGLWLALLALMAVRGLWLGLVYLRIERGAGFVAGAADFRARLRLPRRRQIVLPGRLRRQGEGAWWLGRGREIAATTHMAFGPCRW